LFVKKQQKDGKRPDVSTILPWSRGKPLACDVTVPDTLCRNTYGQLSQTGRCCSHSGSQQQGDEIRPVDPGPMFYPVAIETLGTWHYQTIELVKEIGKRTTKHQHHWRSQGDGVSVSAAVHGTSKGKRCFFSKYFRCQLVRCNPLSSCLLNICLKTEKK